MKIVALASEHVESAAELLADLHVAVGTGAPASTLAERDVARRAVVSAIDSGPGVAALQGSAVVGYMVAPLPNVPGPGGSRLRPAHHAARPDQARLAYRQMYEAIARQLVAAGCTYHSLPIATSWPEALNTFFELEFGVDQIKGSVAIAKVPDAPPRADSVRAAAGSDLDGLLQLAIELQKFHSRAPMFQAALLDVPGIRQALIGAIASDDATVLVATEGDRIVAMMQAEPDGGYADAAQIGMNIVTETARSAGLGTAMLDVLLRWAADRGYSHCTVGWTSSNPTSDAFYRSRGFTPLRNRLHRRIDPRVAWANDSLDYSAFRLR